jgi:multidrug efflux pump subunit AcrB
VDVIGVMHFWGLTLDTVSCVILVIAIGLCVDYSAHIGHTFMTLKGSRLVRARVTLKEIGPAVFHGGFSTFLAFILLSGSDSYVFSTFFKVFFCVVLFGMFHGIVFLPVLLSLIGPAPYENAVDALKREDTIREHARHEPQLHHEHHDKQNDLGRPSTQSSKRNTPSPNNNGNINTVYKNSDRSIKNNRPQPATVRNKQYLSYFGQKL